MKINKSQKMGVSKTADLDSEFQITKVCVFILICQAKVKYWLHLTKSLFLFFLLIPLIMFRPAQTDLPKASALSLNVSCTVASTYTPNIGGSILSNRFQSHTVQNLMVINSFHWCRDENTRVFFLS